MGTADFKSVGTNLGSTITAFEHANDYRNRKVYTVCGSFIARTSSVDFIYDSFISLDGQKSSYFCNIGGELRCIFFEWHG